MSALPSEADIKLKLAKGAANDPKRTFPIAQKVQIKLADWTNHTSVLRLKSNNDKAKPAERWGRKATGPRFLREATEQLPEGLQDRRVAAILGRAA